MKVNNFHYRIVDYNLECTAKSTKQGPEQGLALKDKDKDKDLIFKEGEDEDSIHKDRNLALLFRSPPRTRNNIPDLRIQCKCFQSPHPTQCSYWVLS